jgi:hypothetical protein
VSGPWEKYQGGQPEAQPGPWAKYQAPSAPEQPGMVEELLRQGGLGARYLLEGLSTPVAIVGDAANGAANLGISGINAVAGTNIPKFESYADYTKRSLDKVLPSPKTPEERVIGDMSRFVATAGGSAGAAKVGEMMGTKALAPFGENMAGQGLAALTGGGAYGVAGEATDNPLIKGGAALLGGAAGAGIASALERATPSAAVKIPTTPQIKASSQAAYKASEDAGLIIKPAQMQKLSASVKEKLADLAFDPDDQPMIARALGRLDKAGAENITLKGVDAIRKKVVNILKDGNNTERMMAGKILSYIDDSMTSLTPDDVVQGNTDDAVKMLKDAQGLWRVQAKSQLIDDLVAQAERQAARSNSGGNLQNALKQKLGSILDKPKLARMFSPEEKAAIDSIVKGNPVSNALRIVGRLAPSSNSWLPILLGGGPGGYAAGGLTGAALALGVPAAGSIAKATATGMTKGAVNRLSEMVRSNAIPRVPQQTPPFDPQQFLIQSLLQGTRLQPPNAYADALLRSGAVSVPASGNPNTGPQPQP